MSKNNTSNRFALICAHVQMNRLRRIRLRRLYSSVQTAPPHVFTSAAELLEAARRGFCEILPGHFAALLSAAEPLYRVRIMQQMSKYASPWQCALLPVYRAFMMPEGAFLSVFGNLVEFLDSDSVFCFLAMFGADDSRGSGTNEGVLDFRNEYYDSRGNLTYNLPLDNAHMLAWVLCLVCKYHPQVGFSLLRILGPRICTAEERGSGLLYTPRMYLMQAFMRLYINSGDLAETALNPLLQLTVVLTLYYDEIDEDVAQFIAYAAEGIDFATVRPDNLQIMRRVLDCALDFGNRPFGGQDEVSGCTKQTRVLYIKESLKAFDRLKSCRNCQCSALNSEISCEPVP